MRVSGAMLGSGLGSRSSFNLRELVGDDDIAPKRKKPKFGLSNAPDKEAESKLKYEYAVRDSPRFAASV